MSTLATSAVRCCAATLVVLAASLAAAQAVYAQAASPARPGEAFASVSGHPATPNLALFYGSNVPVDLLQAFDAVVLDPARGFDPAAHPLAHTVWIARTHPADPGVTPNAFAQSLAPLWQRGYRGFLLDTPAALVAAEICGPLIQMPAV